MQYLTYISPSIYNRYLVHLGNNSELSFFFFYLLLIGCQASPRSWAPVSPSNKEANRIGRGERNSFSPANWKRGGRSLCWNDVCQHWHACLLTRFTWQPAKSRAGLQVCWRWSYAQTRSSIVRLPDSRGPGFPLWIRQPCGNECRRKQWCHGPRSLAGAEIIFWLLDICIETLIMAMIKLQVTFSI